MKLQFNKNGIIKDFDNIHNISCTVNFEMFFLMPSNHPKNQRFSNKDFCPSL